MMKEKVFLIPFKETSWGMVRIKAKSQKEALAKYNNEKGYENYSPYDDMDYCGDCECDFSPENIEEG